MQSCNVEWHYEEDCISLLLLLVERSRDFVMRVRKNDGVARPWSNTGGNRRHTALEARRGWPLFLCLSVLRWLWDSQHTQPIWFNKGRKQTVTGPWETADRGWRRVKLISHMMWCSVWGGGEALRVKRSGNSYSTRKIDVNIADLNAVLQRDF